MTELLKEAKVKFDEDEDIYVGIEAEVEKLTHYYDQLSPMVGISLILDPTMKKDYLADELEWEKTWTDTVFGHFNDAFTIYKARLPSKEAVAQVTDKLGEKNSLSNRLNLWTLVTLE
jgi:hypothetical protein